MSTLKEIFDISLMINTADGETIMADGIKLTPEAADYAALVRKCGCTEEIKALVSGTFSLSEAIAISRCVEEMRKREGSLPRKEPEVRIVAPVRRLPCCRGHVAVTANCHHFRQSAGV